jgi:hypothetical protein
MVADSFYAKARFASGVTDKKIYLIRVLCHDSDFHWLCAGQQKPNGRRREFGDKVCFDDLTHFDWVGDVEGQRIYTATVNSPTFKLTLRLVYLVREENGKTYTALLFSTDFTCPALDILRFYKVRFQIEFLFRDAKQHTELCDCQTTRQATLDFHFNASLAAHDCKTVIIIWMPKPMDAMSFPSPVGKSANSTLICSNAFLATYNSILLP